MNPPFKTGDQVTLLSLKRIGTVLSVSGKNSIKISIGDLQMYCKPSDLEPATGIREKPERRQRGLSFERPKTKASVSLDLHGYTAQSAKEALLTFISDAVMAGHPQVSIIHGHGGGTIKQMVQATLSELEVVASFRHPINNTAETKVYFR